MDGLQAALRLPRALCAVLASRGLADADQAKAFLRPSLSELHSPNDLPDLSRAVSRILQAMERGEEILVHGDFDVDGMAGTALLTRWITRLGGRCSPFIPNRIRDGYDLGPAGIEAAVARGCSLIVSVDCGIHAHEAVEAADALGLSVIITDHHTPGDRHPPALAVVHPGRRDSAYPNPHLCGAGVAFKVCQGLADATGTPQEELHPLLDLVGMATIADLVPLRGENRVLAHFGLKALKRTSNLGLRALMADARMAPKGISAGSVAFGLAPRLNALGRLGDGMDGVRLLLAEEEGEAIRLARRAGEVNRERREMDGRILEEALDRLEGTYDPERDYGVVLEGEGWHPGVVGIVASRVAEILHRPAVLIALDGERGKGSARSIPEFHILEAFQACAGLLDRFGGHRQAAGMEIHAGRIPEFRKAFNRAARMALEGESLRPRLPVDLEIDLGEVSEELHKYLAYMGPHGLGNPGPVFLARNIRLSRPPRIVGDGHLKLGLQTGRGELDAIGFNLAGRIPPESLASGSMDLVFQLSENEYRGRRHLQARIKDLRSGSSGAEGLEAIS